MAHEQYIISLSGGKDSTAMFHWMIEKGENIHSAIFFDTGWEFPEMYDHINLIEEKTGFKVVRLKSKHSFDYWMYEREIKARKGPMKGSVHRIGNGWPSSYRRWCTREKVETIKRYLDKVLDGVSCVGMAADEMHRVRPNIRYPLVEYGKTEADCLRYCKSLGYHWDGLYDVFDRVSCFCCPLQKISTLRKLRKHYPHYWKKIIEMDLKQPRHNQGFKNYRTTIDLEMMFREEDRQTELF